MEYVTIPAMAIRVSGVLALTLGIIFWTGNYQELQPIHIVLGVVVVAALVWLAILFARAGRGSGLTAGAIAVGLVLVLVGATQHNILRNSAHWTVQVVHLVLGLAALGLGEVMGARLARKAVA